MYVKFLFRSVFVVGSGVCHLWWAVFSLCCEIKLDQRYGFKHLLLELIWTYLTCVKMICFRYLVSFENLYFSIIVVYAVKMLKVAENQQILFIRTQFFFICFRFLHFFRCFSKSFPSEYFWKLFSCPNTLTLHPILPSKAPVCPACPSSSFLPELHFSVCSRPQFSQTNLLAVLINAQCTIAFHMEELSLAVGFKIAAVLNWGFFIFYFEEIMNLVYKSF